MSAELPRRSLATQQVAAELCTLSRYNKHSSVDVASTLEVNHIKTSVLCDYFMGLCYLVISVICYMNVVYQLVNFCMFSFSYNIIEG